MNLIQLPSEILEKIGDKLEDSTSRLNLRLTCSALKKLIDNYVGVKVTVKEDPLQPNIEEKLNFLSSTCLSYVTSKDMCGHYENNGTRNYFEQQCLFEEIFIFPHYLRTIMFSGKTHAQFIFDVITKCLNLENLCVCDDLEFQEDLVPFLIKEGTQIEFFKKSRQVWLSTICNRDIFRQIKCRKLKRICISKRPEAVLRDNDFINILLLLKCIRSEALERCAICVSEAKDFEQLTEMEYFQLSMIIVNFIQVHIRTIKDLSVTIALDKQRYSHTVEYNEIQGQGDDGMEQRIQMVVALRKKLEIIGKCSRLTFLTVDIPYLLHGDFWLLWIENLRKLITLRIVGSTKYEILRNCDFIRNFCKSLKRFRLHLDIVNDFDFSGVEQCEKLEEVYIFNKPSTEMTIEGPFEDQVKNVKLIPAGLKSLVLGNVVVATDGLNKLLANQKKLDTLAILNMGSTNPENGADCKCLKKIFRMRYLHSCLVLNFRCKSRKTYCRIMQMLDFQLRPKSAEDKKLWKQLDKIFGYNAEPMLPATLDIVSPEVFRRYIWEKNKKVYFSVLMDNHSMKYNDEDPYL